ncbi:MAG: hypothetical protein KGL42_03745 [Betaproteobacteria bacterium]|jgi:hypothetical protein|nr:hypothetical protein [Betaproteobacteria bacterium]
MRLSEGLIDRLQFTNTARNRNFMPIKGKAVGEAVLRLHRFLTASAPTSR